MPPAFINGNGATALPAGEPLSGHTHYVAPALTRLPPRARFTPRQLQLAFDRVCDPWDSRAPIWAQIPAAERELVEQAVLRRTGSQPVFEEVPGTDRLVVFASGARLGPIAVSDSSLFALRHGMTMRSWDPQDRWSLLRDLAGLVTRKRRSAPHEGAFAPAVAERSASR